MDTATVTNTPSHPNHQLQAAVSSYRMLLDTSFAMQSGFQRFLQDHGENLQANPILVPQVVMQELANIAGAKEPAKRKAADDARGLLITAIERRRAEVRHEQCDDGQHADAVILRVVEQHLMKMNWLVLTNDVDLMLDLHDKLHRRSVHVHKQLLVAKLHAKTGDFEIFSPRPHGVTQHRPAKVAPRANSRPVPVTVPPVTRKVTAFHASTSVTSDPAILAHGGPLAEGVEVHVDGLGQVRLGKMVASGGEGVVYYLEGHPYLFKAYHSHKLTHAREEKIRLMTSRDLSDRPMICWPLAIGRDSSGCLRGFTMRPAQGRPLAHALMKPVPFRRAFPSWTRRDSVEMAIRIVDAIDYLHRLNVLIGDINEQNLLMTDSGMVSFVDCDSYQVEGFASPVGTANFTAPELQGVDLSQVLRTKEHELFAVATLLFMILMPGKTPYAHKGGTDGRRNIAEGLFPYALGEERSSNNAPEGPWRMCWSHLSRGIKEAFVRSFDAQHRNGPRVTIDEWRRLLRQYRSFLLDPAKVFMGPGPRQVGFDLSILPQNRRYTSEDQIPADADCLTDLQRAALRLTGAASSSPTSTCAPNSGQSHIGSTTVPSFALSRTVIEQKLLWYVESYVYERLRKTVTLDSKFREDLNLAPSVAYLLGRDIDREFGTRLGRIDFWKTPAIRDLTNEIAARLGVPPQPCGPGPSPLNPSPSLHAGGNPQAGPTPSVGSTPTRPSAPRRQSAPLAPGPISKSQQTERPSSSSPDVVPPIAPKTPGGRTSLPWPAIWMIALYAGVGIVVIAFVAEFWPLILLGGLVWIVLRFFGEK